MSVTEKTLIFFIYGGECVLMFLNNRSKFLVQTSFSLMLVEIDSNRIVAKMFLTYTIITEKSLIKQKKIASFVKDEEEIVNFIKLKTNNVEIIDIQIGKTLNPADLTSLKVESMEGASLNDIKKHIQNYA